MQLEKSTFALTHHIFTLTCLQLVQAFVPFTFFQGETSNISLSKTECVCVCIYICVKRRRNNLSFVNKKYKLYPSFIIDNS